MTMTKKEIGDAIENACKNFRDENFWIPRNGDHIEMLLPILYDDNDGACVFITSQPSDDGLYVKVSDAGKTSFHQELTMPEVRELCARYHLQFDDMPDHEQTPFKCEIYKVVHISDFDKAVWQIIMLIRDSYEYVMARRIISRIKQR